MAIFGKNRHIYPRKIISRQKFHPPSYLELKFLILTKIGIFLFLTCSSIMYHIYLIIIMKHLWHFELYI